MARLTDEEKKKIYDDNKKKAPTENQKYLLVLIFLCIVLAAYLQLLPRLAMLVSEKGWATGVNGIVLLTYVLFFVILAPVAALEFWLVKKFNDWYSERKKLVNRANSELWNELFNKEGHSDWKSVIERYKDL